MHPTTLFKCLADETRLMCLLLIDKEGELCVCDLTNALQVSQPKISRHLAQLRNCGIVNIRREDQWIYYSISTELDKWAQNIIQQTRKSNKIFLQNCLTRILNNPKRPKCRD